LWDCAHDEIDVADGIDLESGRCRIGIPGAVTPTSYDDGMFDVPTSLSPSRVEAFTSCPLAFRFTSIEKLPEPPSVWTTRGSVVHRALELGFSVPPAERTPDRFRQVLETALVEYRDDAEFTGLGLDDDAATAFAAECRQLVENYLTMEDPRRVRPIGLELRLEARVEGDAGTLALRGIIDRLELRDGELVVTDYKTGRAPSVNWELKSLAGVQFYSFLCEQVFGRRPAVVRLMYLRAGEVIEAVPSAQSVRFISTRAKAVWKAVERACGTGDFRPRPSALCQSCGFQRWCPAFGGDPERAAIEVAEGVSGLLAAV
jgi:putative RecB family exonuclease